MKKRRRRIYLTHAEKAVMWDRWKQGGSLHAIARLLDTSHTSIRRNLVAAGAGWIFCNTQHFQEDSNEKIDPLPCLVTDPVAERAG